VQTNLEGKTVLVTDGAESLGQATALAFAKEGANLLLSSAGDIELLDGAAQQAERLEVRVVVQRCDMGDGAQMSSLVQKGLTEFGRLDVVINNSRPVPPLISLEDIPFELWKTRMGEQLTGTLRLCQEVLPGMVERGWGRIVNYIGLAAFQGTDFINSAVELGLVGMTRGIAREYGRYNITANCIGPAGIETGQGSGPFSYASDDTAPLPRGGAPDEVAFLAVSLASEGSGYVTGQCLLANGGRYFL
jgi:3-oxoacyl-[acyl-carrier protein] reductase